MKDLVYIFFTTEYTEFHGVFYSFPILVILRSFSDEGSRVDKGCAIGQILPPFGRQNDKKKENQNKKNNLWSSLSKAKNLW